MQPLRWTPNNRLILASASPQRAAILTQLGIAHEVRPTEAPELATGEPFALAAENARRKGRAGRDALGVAESATAVVLACDTVVALDGRVYGKPADAREAAAFLKDLQGRTHDVLGALTIAAPDGMIRERTDRTLVTFAALDEARSPPTWRSVSGRAAPGATRSRAPAARSSTRSTATT